jgi:hypothetical protein
MQGNIEELEGYVEDCTPESLPEVGGDAYSPAAAPSPALEPSGGSPGAADDLSF